MLIYSLNYDYKPNACKYYRLQVPFNQMWKFDQSIRHVIDAKEQDVLERIKVILKSDVAHFYQVADENIYSQVKTIHDVKPMQVDGEWKIPPAVVYDSDDNVDYTHPFTPSFVSYGVRNYPDGEFLEPGEILEWDDFHEKKVLWIDGESHYGEEYLDIERNLRNMQYRHEIIRMANGATVVSKSLADYYKNVIGQKNVYILPNIVVLEDYDLDIEVVRKNPDELRILWQGGASHFLDFYSLREAIREVAKKYPQVKWVFFGQEMEWLTSVLPPDRLEYHKWVEFPAYKSKRGLLSIDINLCPLVNNPFNNGKSACKFYEGSVWSKPEATLAANVGPYKEIQDGVTGLLYNSPEHFVQQLSTLIENETLRKTLASNAKEWVLENRTPGKIIPGLIEFYKDLKQQQLYEAKGKKLIVTGR